MSAGTPPPHVGTPPRVGAYGLHLTVTGGDADLLARAGTWLLPADPSWPRWELRYLPWEGPVEPEREGVEGARRDGDELGPDVARLRSYPAGHVEIDRLARRTTFIRQAPMAPEALVHPDLTSTAAIAGHWLGRSTFHAGAFALDGRAWGVLGMREMGKSSLLLSLHLEGLPVVADDFVVVERGHAYSGPRCLDLRQPAAERFGAGTPLGQVGRRERWRVDLPDVEGDYPLAGWILLGWSAEVVVEPLPAKRRLAALAASRGVVAPGVSPPGLLDVATLPMVLFGRPRRWDMVPEGLGRLLGSLSGS